MPLHRLRLMGSLALLDRKTSEAIQYLQQANEVSSHSSRCRHCVDAGTHQAGDARRAGRLALQLIDRRQPGMDIHITGMIF